MSKYHITGSITYRVTVEIDEEIEADNEEEAKRAAITDNEPDTIGCGTYSDVDLSYESLEVDCLEAGMSRAEREGFAKREREALEAWNTGRPITVPLRIAEVPS